MRVPDIIKKASKKLRNNMTPAEVILWNYIKGDKLGIRFLRQKPVYVYTENNGLDRFVIPDFYCYDKKIIIEVDGSIHNLREVLELDQHKEKLLNNLGINIIRIPNEEIINNIQQVIQILNQKIPQLLSLSQREYPKGEGLF